MEGFCVYRRSEKLPILFDTCQTQRWRNALYAAGIDPNRHIKRYKRRKRSVNRRSCQGKHKLRTRTQAVTVNALIVIKRRSRLSAKIKSSRTHAKALL